MKKREYHGMAKSVEYQIWGGILRRCENPLNSSFPYYGGRGIKVCEQWKNSFLKFYEDVGRRPSELHSLDRIDVNGNYEPNNVKWATQKEQRRNVVRKGSKTLSLNKYQLFANATAQYPNRNELGGLMYVTLGLLGEAGEIANKVKKIIRDNQSEINAEVRLELIEEAGDCAWYLSQFAYELGINLEIIALLNLDKLKDRQKRNVIKGKGDTR